MHRAKWGGEWQSRENFLCPKTTAITARFSARFLSAHTHTLSIHRRVYSRDNTEAIGSLLCLFLRSFSASFFHHCMMIDQMWRNFFQNKVSISDVTIQFNVQSPGDLKSRRAIFAFCRFSKKRILFHFCTRARNANKAWKRKDCYKQYYIVDLTLLLNPRC